MRALVFKPIREMSTIQMAQIVGDLVPGISIFGGVVLNHEVGGLNPWAVKSAIDQGGKFIWMPVVDSARTMAVMEKNPGVAQYKKISTLKTKGISLLDSEGELFPEVHEIVDLIAESMEKVVLDMAHIGPEEAFALVDEAKRAGIEKIVSGHMSPLLDYSMDDKRRLIKKGVYLQYVYHTISASGFQHLGYTPESFAKEFTELGPENIIMSTDAGNPIEPDPTEEMRDFMLQMRYQGLSQHDVDLMTKKNPAKLLSLEYP
jgi:hypothetical protein